MQAVALMNIACKTPQSLGKAISKVCEQLPKSPWKIQAITKALATTFGINLLIIFAKQTFLDRDGVTE